MAVIDLDKARAARREARTEAGKDSTQIQLGGQLFTLVDELPYEAVDIFGGSNGPPSMAGLAALILADLGPWLSQSEAWREAGSLAEPWDVFTLSGCQE